MGKQGPCCHCGISTTPLWRNGPPEKPVLCNACGSRWKTKGTLLNYMPMHSGGFGANPDASGDGKWSRGKKGSHRNTDIRSLKRKETSDGERVNAHFRADQTFAKVHVEEAVFRSLPELSMPNSEGPLRRIKGLKPVSSVMLRAPRPCTKKRSASLRVRKPAEKINTFVASFFMDHDPMTHSVPEPSGEAMLNEHSTTLLEALGRGGLCVRPLLSVPQEPETETAPKFSDLKRKRPFHVSEYSEFDSGPSFYVHDKYIPLRGKEKAKQVPEDPGAEYIHGDKILIPNKLIAEKCLPSKRDFLASSQSPLVYLEMKDIVNYDTFTGLLTEQEQGQLMQLLSSADVARVPESLKSMFSSAQLESALVNFQHLLSEGLLDSSELSLDPRLLQHYQQLLSVTDLPGSGWMERTCQLQNLNKRKGFAYGTKSSGLLSLTASTPPLLTASALPSPSESQAAQPRDFSKEKFKGLGLHVAATPVSSGPFAARLLPSRSYEKIEDDYKPTRTNYYVAGTSSSASPTDFYNGSPLKHEPVLNQGIGISSNEAASTMEGEAKIDNAFFLGDGAFHSALGRDPLMGDDYLDLGGIDVAEADSLLFDVPNHMSFQQAELLQQPPSLTKPKFMKEDENEESGGLIMSNTWHTDPDPPSLLWNSSTFGPARALPNGTILNPSRNLS